MLQQRYFDSNLLLIVLIFFKEIYLIEDNGRFKLIAKIKERVRL